MNTCQTKITISFAEAKLVVIVLILDPLRRDVRDPPVALLIPADPTTE
jgi:hypothetical protein